MTETVCQHPDIEISSQCEGAENCLLFTLLRMYAEDMERLNTGETSESKFNLDSVRIHQAVDSSVGFCPDSEGAGQELNQLDLDLVEDYRTTHKVPTTEFVELPPWAK